MIWATISSQLCFCWLHRASPSLAAKNIINLILVLAIWWCPCIELSFVLLDAGVCCDQCVLLAKLLTFTLFQAKLACYSKYLLISYFCIPLPYDEKDLFFGVIGLHQFSCLVVSESLQPHESQHARSPYPSPTPGVHPNSCPLSQWCHPAISSSVVLFSSCPQSLPVSGLFQWVNSSHKVAKVLEFQPQHQSFQCTPRTGLL